MLGKEVGYGIFNVHTGFDEESLDGAIELLKTAEALFEKEEIASLSGFCALRRWIDNLDTRWLDGKIRRFQSYALMSAEPGAHYGLGLDAYATWTSPSANTATWSTIAYSRRSSPARPRVSAPAWS